MKNQFVPTQCPVIELKDKNGLRLVASGGSISKANSKTLRERFVSICRWVANDWDRSEFIHQQVQARREEILLQNLKHGLPPRIF